MVARSGDVPSLSPLGDGLSSTRRRVLLASLLAALPLGLSTLRAAALNPSETQVTLPDQINGRHGLLGRRTAPK